MHHDNNKSLSLSIPTLLELSGWFPQLEREAQARVLDDMPIVSTQSHLVAARRVPHLWRRRLRDS